MMKKLSSVQKSVIAIGLISIISSLAALSTGQSFKDCWCPAFLGLTLIGSALIQNRYKVQQKIMMPYTPSSETAHIFIGYQ